MNSQHAACCENYRKASKIKGKAIITKYETKMFEKHVKEAEIFKNHARSNSPTMTSHIFPIFFLQFPPGYVKLRRSSSETIRGVSILLLFIFR